MNIKIPKNHCLVLIKSRWKEKYEAESGFELYRETHKHSDRYQNSETTGRVLAVWEGLSDRIDRPTRCRNPRIPADRLASMTTRQKMEKEMMPYTALEGTFAGLEPGDTIHFSYEAMFEFDEQQNNSATVMLLSSFPYMAPDIDDPSGYEVVPILADQILAIERNGKLIAVGGKALMEPIEEEEVEGLSKKIHIPEHFRKNKISNTGRLISASRPMKGLYGIQAEPGDTVFYKRKLAEYFEWKGKKIEWMYLTEIEAYVSAKRVNAG